MLILPLLAHDSPDRIVAWRAEGAVTVGRFLAEVNALAAYFPAGKNLLNLCGDRYRFSVGLAAAIVAGKTSLLPSTRTSGVIRQIRDFAPDVFCLCDKDINTVDLPQVRYPDLNKISADHIAMPRIDAQQLVAIVFTSGSTGAPQPHHKHWGALVNCVRAEALRLELASDKSCTIVATVPPQHMYGFETTVLMPWQNGHALSHAQPFYPADICQALAAVAAPRVLVSSPVHLRALLEAQLALPDIARVVCATAPLSDPLAQAIEAHCRAPLFEIYGSTETGQIASRRTTRTRQWHLFPGVTFVADGERVRAEGGHVEQSVLMNDVIEPVGDAHFLLNGRIADLVNIAGKRHSLASLNHLLTTIPGVVDGTFYMPDTGGDAEVTRLAACVVAPGMDAPRLLSALREHLDPVFLPRPLLFVDALPRNSAGKLPRSALQALFQNPKARPAP